MSYLKYTTQFPKQQQLLVRWLEHGIPRFRKAAEIPQNVISDPTVERICQAIDDDILIRTAEDLGVVSSAALYEAASSIPDLNVALATVEAQNAMRQWIVEHQPILILRALGKAVFKLTPRITEGSVQDACRIVRIVFVLALAPFSPSSADLLSQFGTILNCHELHRMIEKFTVIAIKGESETIQKMDYIILSNDQWGEWSLWFMEQAQSLAPQCWGKLSVSRQRTDLTPWHEMWDSLLKEGESNAN